MAIICDASDRQFSHFPVARHIKADFLTLERDQFHPHALRFASCLSKSRQPTIRDAQTVTLSRDVEGAKIFICGSRQMGQEVVDTLEKIYSEGKGLSVEESKESIKKLEQEKVIMKELWG